LPPAASSAAFAHSAVVTHSQALPGPLPRPLSFFLSLSLKAGGLLSIQPAIAGRQHRDHRLVPHTLGVVAIGRDAISSIVIFRYPLLCGTSIRCQLLIGIGGEGTVVLPPYRHTTGVGGEVQVVQLPEGRITGGRSLSTWSAGWTSGIVLSSSIVVYFSNNTTLFCKGSFFERCIHREQACKIPFLFRGSQWCAIINLFALEDFPPIACSTIMPFFSKSSISGLIYLPTLAPCSQQVTDMTFSVLYLIGLDG
jgi:hypothetical protein